MKNDYEYPYDDDMEMYERRMLVEDDRIDREYNKRSKVMSKPRPYAEELWDTLEMKLTPEQFEEFYQLFISTGLSVKFFCEIVNETANILKNKQ